MTYQTTRTIESNAVPGATFTLKRVGHGMRTRIEVENAETRRDMREAVAEWADATKVPIPDRTLADLSRISDADEKYTMAVSTFKGRWVAAGLVGVEGAISMTPADMIEFGPIELFEEIYEAIASEAYPSTKDKENFKLPTTSPAVVDGQMSSTVAESASESASIMGGTALGISPI